MGRIQCFVVIIVAIVVAVTFAVVCVQFEVLVSDQSDPERTDTATVDVTVIRDTFAPRFLSTPYSTIVDFNAVVGSSIFRVTATDDDQVVSAPRPGRAHGPWTHRLVDVGYTGWVDRQAGWTLDRQAGWTLDRQAGWTLDRQAGWALGKRVKDGVEHICFPPSA